MPLTSNTSTAVCTCLVIWTIHAHNKKNCIHTLRICPKTTIHRFFYTLIRVNLRGENNVCIRDSTVFFLLFLKCALFRGSTVHYISLLIIGIIIDKIYRDNHSMLIKITTKSINFKQLVTISHNAMFSASTSLCCAMIHWLSVQVFWLDLIALL